ncbi:MAG: response regulator transcription factor [Syntrophomonadaceae bacterium]|nr:response regulator transcription factor [Syntrophomonadaceae bacterium]
MSSVLILEDDLYTNAFIKKLISKNPLIENIYCTTTGGEAIKFIEDYRPDIAILDIKLADGDRYDGIEVGKITKHISPYTDIVYITGYPQYALEAYTAHPYNYILKPINQEKFHTTISSLLKINQGKKEKLLIIKEKNKIKLFKPSEICFIERNANKTIMYTSEGLYETSSKKFNEILKSLPSYFYKVHQSFLVNINYVEEIEITQFRTYNIVIKNYDIKVPLSRQYYAKLKYYLGY